jgi:hypothetical protein
MVLSCRSIANPWRGKRWCRRPTTLASELKFHVKFNIVELVGSDLGVCPHELCGYNRPSFDRARRPRRRTRNSSSSRSATTMANGALQTTVSRRRIRRPSKSIPESDAGIVYSRARVESQSQAECTNPATGRTIGSYTEARAEEATPAIATALKAFRDTDWRDNHRLRANVLKPLFAKWSK